MACCTRHDSLQQVIVIHLPMYVVSGTSGTSVVDRLLNRLLSGTLGLQSVQKGMCKAAEGRRFHHVFARRDEKHAT